MWPKITSNMPMPFSKSNSRNRPCIASNVILMWLLVPWSCFKCCLPNTGETFDVVFAKEVAHLDFNDAKPCCRFYGMQLAAKDLGAVGEGLFVNHVVMAPQALFVERALFHDI